jgi:hypothetical protein
MGDQAPGAWDGVWIEDEAAAFAETDPPVLLDDDAKTAQIHSDFKAMLEQDRINAEIRKPNADDDMVEMQHVLLESSSKRPRLETTSLATRRQPSSSSSSSSSESAWTIPDRYSDLSYFRGTVSERFRDFEQMKDRPDVITRFVQVICRRFFALTHGFEKDGKPITWVTVTVDQVAQAVGYEYYISLCSAPHGIVHRFSFSDVLLNCRDEWHFLEGLHTNGPNVFTLGTHARVGAQSSVRRATQHDLFERQLFGIVFQFARAPKRNELHVESGRCTLCCVPYNWACRPHVGPPPAADNA